MRAVTASATALLAGTALSGTAYAQAGPAEFLPVPVYNWTGFYVGIHGGGVWGDEDHGDFGECGPFTNLAGEDSGGDVTFESVEDLGCFDGFPVDGPNAFDGTFPSFDLDDDYVAWTGSDRSSGDVRGLFGGHAGYNMQSGRLVFGIEGDISGVFGDDNSQEVTFDYFHDAFDGPCFLFGCDLEDYEGTGIVRSETAVEWLATIRGRIGAALDAQGRFLLYGTGGLAIAGIENSISGEFDELSGKGAVDFCQDGCFFEDGDEGDDTQLGITVGVGGEYAFTNNMSFGLQYLYTHFDDSDGNSITFVGDDERQFDVELGGGIEDLHSVTARLTWRFGGPPLPPP